MNCKTCGKTTWAGCGQHVASVKSSVPASQWCDGTHTQADPAAAASERGGIFARLFGR
ncbi:hypothetical protein GCM10011366_05860 [Ornithinimicrobium tianjinense]|uniref:Uncharacterized protein n=1 Tax=Ornithinimicrobium tianjinense TaxID=1195761 RepID=A0A917BF42_9MICO|nr:hypothetical protein GCM10011366_05860 [Ornithinimicrobium tianjinense]